jgi:hypothetical protein
MTLLFPIFHSTGNQTVTLISKLRVQYCSIYPTSQLFYFKNFRRILARLAGEFSSCWQRAGSVKLGHSAGLAFGPQLPNEQSSDGKN